jgi:FlaA1/EpsC-like NDP-sugar epimerase
MRHILITGGTGTLGKAYIKQAHEKVFKMTGEK